MSADLVVKIRILSDRAKIPHYATAQAAGCDLYCAAEKPIWLESLERTIVPTGLAMEIPPGFEAQIRPRSGIAYQRGITLPNSPGTIDADYRGELKVLLVNISAERQCIEPGERIAQMVIARCEQARFDVVTILTETERGGGGFGHTGRN